MTNKQRIISIIVILFSLGISFILGRISISKNKPESSIQIISSQDLKKENSEKLESTSGESLKIRASSRGSKYYLPWCKSTFNEENIIFFSSAEEAEKAGYEKATDCLLDSN